MSITNFTTTQKSNINNNVIEKSPFSYYEGEMAVEEVGWEYSRYIPLNTLQANILRIVNQYLLATKAMIVEELNSNGYSIKSEGFHKMLKLLVENEYLVRVSFQAPNKPISITKFYKLGRKGRGFIAHDEIAKSHIRLAGYIESRSACQMKKILSANQAILAIKRENPKAYTETAKIFLVKNHFNHLAANKIFRAPGFVETSDTTYIVQSVRNDKDNKDDLLDKLKRMDKVLKYAKSDLKNPNNIIVLIVAEDLHFMKEYEDILKRCKYSNFEIALSHDRLLFGDKNFAEKLSYVKHESVLKRLLRAC